MLSSNGSDRLRSSLVGITALVVFTLLLQLRTQARAELASEVIWIARKTDTLALWAQIDPSGHARLQIRSVYAGSGTLSIMAELEVAVQLDPERYRVLRGSFAEAGIRAGDHVSGRSMKLGIAPVPGPTHHVLDADARPLLEAFEQAFLDTAGDYRSKWAELLRLIKAAGLSCVIEPSAHASFTLRRGADGASARARLEGEGCILPSKVRSILEGLARPDTALVFFDLTMHTFTARVALTVDGGMRLLANGRPVQAGNHLNWQAENVLLRPAAAEAVSGEILVQVTQDTRLRVARSLWRDDIRILVRSRPRPRHADVSQWEVAYSNALAAKERAERGRVADVPFVDSEIVARGGQVVSCRGIAACATIDLPELRGLAAAAWGQCTSLKGSIRHDKDARSAFHLEVEIGSTRCSLSLARHCLNDPGEGLEYLTRRLSKAHRRDTGDMTRHFWCYQYPDHGECGVGSDYDE